MEMRMHRIVSTVMGAILFCTATAWAVPETVSVRITDVTPSSFSVVWLTNVPAQPTVQVFSDASGNDDISTEVGIQPMPDMIDSVAAAAKMKGVMKVRVSGLTANTVYAVRTVSVDPSQTESIGYSALQTVTTAERVDAHRTTADGTLEPRNNDLLTFSIYIRPGHLPQSGELILLESDTGSYPVSAFVGQDIAAPEGLIDLNNLFDFDGISLDVIADENATLRIYRGGTLSTLLHYRTFAENSSLVNVTQPVRGFFEDVNLDGRIDAADFALFKEQYRQVADGSLFNPDFNFITVEQGVITNEDVIDARDFASFATQYGRTDTGQN
jgi:hypothetical protein